MVYYQPVDTFIFDRKLQITSRGEQQSRISYISMYQRLFRSFAPLHVSYSSIGFSLYLLSDDCSNKNLPSLHGSLHSIFRKTDMRAFRKIKLRTTEVFLECREYLLKYSIVIGGLGYRSAEVQTINHMLRLQSGTAKCREESTLRMILQYSE